MKILTTLCAAFFVTLALAAGAAPKIERIVVRSTTMQNVPESLVRANILLREGQTFSRKVLSEDIKRLYASRQFDDIASTVTPLANGNIQLTFTITPKPRVAEILFQGNRKISDKRLRKELKQKKGDILDEELLADDLRALYKIYQSKGYHEVSIHQVVERPEKKQTVNVLYDIDEKSRYKTRAIHFVGNTVFSARKLRKKMKTDVSTWGRILPVGFFNQETFAEDLDQLRSLYHSKGYLDFQVEKVERNFNRSGSLIYLTLHLSEGEPYTIRSISITGNKAYKTETLMKIMKLKSKDVYNETRQNQDAQALRDFYNKNGYLDVAVNLNIQPNAANHTVTLQYYLHEGVSSSIRNINISGNRITHDKVIRRELEIHPGDKSDNRKIEASKMRLMNLGYFEKVEAIPVSTEDPKLKDVTIQVTEKPTGRLMLSAGFSSVDSLMVGVEVSQSNFDLRNPPAFRGGGQRFRVQASAGTTRQDYTISFTEPWLFDRPLRLDTDLWNRSISSNRDYDQDSVGTSLRLTKKMPWKFWRLSTGYRLENININDIDDSYSADFIANEEKTNLVSALTLGLVRDHRDRLVKTSSGSRLALNLELQSKAIGSYGNFYKLNVRGDKYFPIFRKSVIKFSGELGQVQDIASDEPKVFDRLFTGGANSIRGFPEREVGPFDPANEDPVGGKSILLASAEFRTPVYEETVYWACFVDSGNVWKDSFGWDPSDLNVGVGMGIRLFLPIGAIRLDYGFPVSRQEENLSSGGRLHFNLGYNF